MGYNKSSEIVELEISVNHIHMVVRSEPKIAPSYIMKVIKIISARDFFRLHKNIKRRFFLSGKLWTQSYVVAIIGNASEDIIRKYVRNQLIEMDKQETRVRYPRDRFSPSLG